MRDSQSPEEEYRELEQRLSNAYHTQQVLVEKFKEIDKRVTKHASNDLKKKLKISLSSQKRFCNVKKIQVHRGTLQRSTAQLSRSPMETLETEHLILI